MKVYSAPNVEIWRMMYTQWSAVPRIDIKRCDRVHPVISGNKWYKLKYNLEKVRQSGLGQIITFGGPWSNHIHATAYAAAEAGVKSIGLIRGEEPAEWSETLKDAEKWGMQIEFISREAYREKDSEDFKMWLLAEYGPSHIIPEGGANYLGINGCMEMLEARDENYDIICCSAGTGTMAAGIALSLKPHQRLCVFSALKGGFMRDQVRSRLRYFLMDDAAVTSVMEQITVNEEYHFGGYAKWNDDLLAFIKQARDTHELPLDQVYTGKLMYGINAEVRRGNFLESARVLAIHSGGLQGIRSVTSA